MAKEFIIYCDESVSDGRYYSNFYGGALIRSDDIDDVRRILREKKAELNLMGEIKWGKVTGNYLDKYKSIMTEFFAMIRADRIKARIMFTHNMHPARSLTKEQVENEYFILYYQFVKHAFGLICANDDRAPITLRLFFDQMPDTREKIEKFKAYISSLTRNPQFRAAQISILTENITDTVSHDHDILQCLDIVLGAMQFRLNDLHRVIPKGATRRGKRTRAKEALYRLINSEIQKIYPHFNIGISTGTAGGVADRWRHSYRHWRFMAENRDFIPAKKK